MKTRIIRINDIRVKGNKVFLNGIKFIPFTTAENAVKQILNENQANFKKVTLFKRGEFWEVKSGECNVRR